jgi:hypothetical protein
MALHLIQDTLRGSLARSVTFGLVCLSLTTACVAPKSPVSVDRSRANKAPSAEPEGPRPVDDRQWIILDPTSREEPPTEDLATTDNRIP